MRELLKEDGADQSVDLHLAEVVRRVRNGDLDDTLVYRKNLRKDTEQYTATHRHTSPPHANRHRRGNVSSATS
jgi:DNA polymerase-2